METIGDKIRIQRMIKGYSQEAMAFELNISQAAYSNLESNKTEVTIKRLIEISEILEISPYALMPKSKYGSGFNYVRLWRTIKIYGKLWIVNLNKRRQHPPAA